MTDISVYTIDSGVPLPAERVLMVPLKHLEIGQSILFPLEKRRSVATMASVAAKTLNRKFTIRKQNAKEARVWRVE